jgi:hypothetical protein
MNLLQSNIKNWNDVDVETFVELKSIDINEYNTRYAYLIEQLCIVSNIDFNDELFDDITVDELEKAFDQIAWLNTEPNKNIKEIISIDDVNYKLKPIREISIGEYIDLDIYFAQGYFKNFKTILATLYRKFNNDQFNNQIIESYDYNPVNRQHTFDELNINDVYGIIPEFIAFKNDIENTYKNVFENNKVDDEEELDEEISIAEKIKMKREAENEKKLEAFSWHNTIYNLANQDITKMKDVLNLKAVFVFNMLSFIKAVN